MLAWSAPECTSCVTSGGCCCPCCYCWIHEVSKQIQQQRCCCHMREVSISAQQQGSAAAAAAAAANDVQAAGAFWSGAQQSAPVLLELAKTRLGGSLTHQGPICTSQQQDGFGERKIEACQSCPHCQQADFGCRKADSRCHKAD